MLRALHAWVGAILSLLLMLIAATGTALVWKDSFIRMSFPGDAVGLEPGIDNLAQLAESAEMAFGAQNLNRIRFGDKHNGVSLVQLVDDRAAYMAADGAVLEEWEPNGRLEDWLLDLHHRLLAGTVGLYVVGAAGLGAMGLLLSGWVVWWPTRSRWRQGLLPQRLVRAQLRLSHRNLGMLFSVPMAILIVSGIVLTFPDKTQPLFYSMEDDSYGENFGDDVDMLEGASEASWRRVLLRATSVFPNARITGLDWPNFTDDKIVLLRNKDEWAQTGNSRVHITGYDGMMSMRIDAQQLPAGERLFQAMRTVHTGGYDGWVDNLLLSIIGIGMMSVGLIGFLSFCLKAFR